MKVTPPAFVSVPEGRSVNQGWVQLIWHPATPNRIYTVRHGHDGKPFQAWLDSGFNWFKVLPDANNDGTRELGERIRTVLDLHYVKVTII